MTYDTTRTYCTSDTQPESPLYHDYAVILIEDVRDEGIDEETGAHQWSYIQTQILPYKEYLPMMRAEDKTANYETTIELIEELRPEE